MKTRIARLAKLSLILVTLVASGLLARATSITLVNPSFELNTSGQQITTKNTNGFSGYVQGWLNAGTTYANSGLDYAGDSGNIAQSGSVIAFCDQGDSGAYQITGYQLVGGETITLTWWAKGTWGSAHQNVELLKGASTSTPYSSLAVLATSTAALNNTGNGGAFTQYTLTYTATGADVGSYLAVSFTAPGAAGSWATFDSFSLNGVTLPFTHPGVLFQQADLDRMKTEVAAQASPWYPAWQNFMTSVFAQSNYVPYPQVTMTLFGGESVGQIDNDSEAALYNAVEWYITGNQAYATEADSIINGWTGTLTSVPNGGDYQLAIGNAAENFAAAGDILTYEPGSGFTTANQVALQNMMENLFYPDLTPPLDPYNHGTTQLRGLIAMGIYCNDVAKYNTAVGIYKASGDIVAPGCSNTPGSLETDVIEPFLGENAESYRDGVHPAGGIAGLAYTALMAWNSNGDSSLFTFNDNELLSGSEYVAQWDAGYYNDFVPYIDCTSGSEQWNWGGVSGRGINNTLPSQLLLAQYTRLGLSCPYTAWTAQQIRSADSADTLFFTLATPAMVTAPTGNKGAGTGGGSIANGTYELVNRMTAFDMDVYQAKTAPTTPVDQWTTGGGTNQAWQVSSLGNGMYKIIGVGSGLALEVPGSLTTNGQQLDISTWTGAANQEWILTPTSNGYLELSNVNSGFVIGANGGSGPGAAVTQMSSNSDAFNQQWGFVPQSSLINRGTEGTASASSHNPPMESCWKAFDGSSSTKWYNYTGTGSLSPTGWLQYHFLFEGFAVTQYTITSANDVPQRDPASWQFQGSNDGSTWTTLDTQSGQSFANRYQTNTYPISNTTNYKYYRLNITANNGGSGYGLQLSELGLWAK